MAVNFVAFLLLSSPANKNLVWIFAVLWGFMLGKYIFCCLHTHTHTYSRVMIFLPVLELTTFIRKQLTI